MPYKMNWYIENEVVYTQYWGVTTAEEMQNSLIQVKEFIDHSERQLVHMIMDVSAITEAVPLTDSIRITREVGPHERAGWTVTVGEKSPISKMASAMGASLFKLRLKGVGTLDEAFDHLKFFDSTLSWDKAEESILSR